MRSRFAIIAAVALAAAMAACSDSGGSDTTGGGAVTTTPTGSTSTAAPSGPTEKVTIANIAFDAPDTIPVGTTLVVENQDNISHTFTSSDDLFDSDTISPGASFQVTFDEPGEYAFFCKFHPDRMMGTITVEG